MKPILFLLPLLPMALGAETVLLDENFNDGDYNKTIAYTIDNDGLLPHSSIQSLFLSSATGTYQPWWIVRDSSAATDMGMASHSMYQEPAQSDDWMITVPFTVPTEGFVLQFDAQSLTLTKASDKLSDLQLFVTEGLVDPDNLPTDPTHVWERIPVGQKFDEIEGDYTRYTFSLDPWVGKEIRLNFVNRNNDKEILVLDNIKVSRSDAAEFAVDPLPRYTTDATYQINAHVEVLAQEGIADYAIKVGDETVEQGKSLAKGSHDFSFTRPIDTDATHDVAVTLTAEGQAPLTRNVVISRLTFAPERKVLIEETTGAWCGNCPMGMYNVEQMLADEQMSRYAIPVAVHIAGGAPDKMVCQSYAEQLGINVAPSFTLNRRSPYVTLTPAHDALFDPTDDLSLASRVRLASEQTTPVEIMVDATPIVENGDTVAVNATAVVRSGLSVGNGRYRVGFILTENNVTCPGSPYWVQDNYFSGNPYESKLGGWTELPENVKNVRYHDVARVIQDFNGIVGSLPMSMDADESYPVAERIDIPKLEKWDNYGFQESCDVRPCNVEVIAFVIDSETEEVANADICPLDPQAPKRFTTWDLVAEMSGIEEVGVSGNGQAVYYDLTGRRVAHPATGVYVKVQDGRAVKVAM